jgi:tRNA(Phe) wybutosine-synthesizing methylase Tyw3
MLHHYPFAWEAAVLDVDGSLRYDTPLTSDVEVFTTDEEANDFIRRAKFYFHENNQKPRDDDAICEAKRDAKARGEHIC